MVPEQPRDKSILESWKEISDYLKHSIRTCQRWENEFGLPVHRFDATAKGRVFANPAELDVWIEEKLHLAETSERSRPLFRSLAVLPLRNFCGDKERDYLADGMTEALITELGQIRALRVISHQSVRQFQGTGKTIPEIAKILRVDALIEGALLKAGDRMSFSLNLMGVYPERHIWAQAYECREREVAGLQRRIARTVAEQAGVELRPQIEERLSTPLSVNLKAYEAYLRGKASVERSFLRADIERALGYFEKAIEIDPDFAPAYAEKGWVYGQLGIYSHLPPHDAFPKQKEAAQRALEIDPLLAEGYAELGLVGMVYEWDWLQSESYFKRALELNPNSHRAHFHYVHFLGFVGRSEESIALQQRLLELDPLNPESHWNMGWVLLWAQKYDEALDVFKTMQELSPEDHWLQMALGVVYSLKDMPQEAMDICEKARSGVPLGLDWQFDCFTAIIRMKAGGSEKAKGILEQLKETSKKRTVDYACIAGVYATLGDIEEAMVWLEKGFQEHSPMLVYLKVAPFWKNLGSDPRFQRLLRRMNFPE